MQPNKNKIGIIGLSYIGHPLAVEFDKKNKPFKIYTERVKTIGVLW
jgi:UDP-N-acetyl-D-mannosaminuronate dehydrogenase